MLDDTREALQDRSGGHHQLPANQARHVIGLPLAGNLRAVFAKSPEALRFSTRIKIIRGNCRKTMEASGFKDFFIQKDELAQKAAGEKRKSEAQTLSEAGIGRRECPPQFASSRHAGL